MRGQTTLTPDAPTLRVREPVTNSAIADQLRRRIVAGELAPGVRLPGRREFEQQFGTTSMTVQRAFDSLTQQEFVTVKGRNTYVSETPPHLSRYALIFPYAPDSRVWTRFYNALLNEAATLPRSAQCRVFIYTGIDGHTDTTEYQNLVEDVRAHRLAGLIFVTHPFRLVGSPILEEPGMPRVYIGSPVRGHEGEVAVVNTDKFSFIDRALDTLEAAGRKRLAVVSHQLPTREQNLYLLEHARKRGFSLPLFRLQTCAIETAAAARGLVNLLMQGGAGERPDALLVTDDNLLEGATAGLLDAGVRVPDEVAVVAHCNFPWPTPSMVPVHRLGFDARAVLQTCLALVAAQRRGEAVAPLTLLPAQFESEIIAAEPRSASNLEESQ